MPLAEQNSGAMRDPVAWTFLSASLWRLAVLAMCLAVISLLCLQSHAQESTAAAAPMDEEKFAKQSAALRTALHYDPSLETPLKSLAKLYREAGRGEELLSLYRNHTTEYPQDDGGRVVLIRLLREMRKPDAAAMVSRARKDFPDSALIAYLAFQEYDREKDPRALDALSEAITAEVKPGRKRLWIDQLIGLAVAEGRPDLAAEHLTALAEMPGQSAGYLMSLARKMQKSKFHVLALTTLEKAAKINTSPELNIDIQLVSAEAEASLKKFVEAGARLDGLLENVAADYWRRPEIVNRRVNLLRTDAAREKMLKQARARFEAEPKSEAAALDLGELLIACELRRDALTALLEASENLPNSDRIEKAVILLFDRLNDEIGSREYLQARVEKYPERVDLAYRYVKALYVSGGDAEALKRFDKLLAELDERQRLDQTLDLARFLRRMGLPKFASTMFARVVDDAPERLDVRRELAESYIAIGKRQEARKLFDAKLAEGAEIENFLDVVQFMVQEDILLEAEKAIKQRLVGDDQNFELRLLLLDVQGKIGDQLAGLEVLKGIRALADTEARYRSWLEAGIKFHELFDTYDSFLDAEQAGFAGGEIDWTPLRIGQLIIYCDVADRSQDRQRAIEVLREQIANAQTAAAQRLELRRLLVRLLEGGSSEIAALEEQFEALGVEDVERSDEYRLRMGKMYSGAGRPDLARPLLENIDFAKISDARLLNGLYQYYVDTQQSREAIAVLERTATLEPTNRDNWEKWLTFLAAMGEESDLRFAIRRLIVGIERMPLQEETYEILRSHLVDSYWRTIASKIASGEPERLGEIFSLLDAIERSVKIEDAYLWVIWTRAHVLNLQGRIPARDEALAMLRSAAPSSEDGVEAMIRFPDGLAVSVESALEILSDKPAASINTNTVAKEGPVPKLKVDWAFETDRLSPIVQTETLPDGDVIVSDRAGTLYRVGGKSGKLIWRRTIAEMAEAFPDTGMVVASSYTQYSESMGRVLSKFVVSPEGGIVLPFGGQVLCLSGETGKQAWVAELAGVALAGAAVANPVRLFVDGDRIVCYDCVTAVATALESDNGKLIWEREILPEKGGATKLVEGNCGASFSEGRLLVYGRHAAIIETETGKMIWSFDAGAARSFPITLPAPEDRNSGGSLGGHFNFPSWGLRTTPQQQPTEVQANYLTADDLRGDPIEFTTQGGSLLAPAAAWLGYLQRGGAGLGVLSGRRLMLFGQGIDVLSLDLPLAGMHRKLLGYTFVGLSGNKACFISETQLGILNLSRNTFTVIDLSKLVANNAAELQITIAGTRIYASGGEGVMCLNVHTGGEIFFSAWPDLVVEHLLPKGARPERRSAMSQHEYFWHGRVLNSASLQGTPYQPLAQPRTAGSSPVVMADAYPLGNLVGDGRLYAHLLPHQIVALSGAAGDKTNKTTNDGDEHKD